MEPVLRRNEGVGGTSTDNESALRRPSLRRDTGSIPAFVLLVGVPPTPSLRFAPFRLLFFRKLALLCLGKLGKMQKSAFP